MEVLRARGITKVFLGVVALNGVDFELKEGEVHALLGENGAGKSTLIKILGGIYRKDRGEIEIDGKVREISTPKDAYEAGISIVPQELCLEPYMSVAENIFLGSFGRFVMDRKRLLEEASLFLQMVGLKIPPETICGDISPAQQKLVSIAKALARGPRILILDEPTTALTREETERLFSILRELQEKKISIIYISHRIEEIFGIADRVTVLRDGNRINTLNINEVDEQKLIRLMIGRELKERFPPKREAVGEEVLRVSGLSGDSFDGISFGLNRKEVLGMAGLVGAGRSEAMKGLVGACRARKRVWLHGEERRIRSVLDAIRCGIAYLPEDRMREGIIPTMNLRENISLAVLDEISRYGFINRRKERQIVQQVMEKLRIKGSAEDPVTALSGGNKQKAILGRWILKNCEVLILDEPTSGIDVGSKAEIYRIMSSLCEKGAGMILISSELPEILGMSDRVLTMYEGRLTGEFSGEDLCEEKIMEGVMGL